jgi:hypothetical protein
MQWAGGVAMQVSGPVGMAGRPAEWQTLHLIPAWGPEVIAKQVSCAAQVPGEKRQVEWQPRQSVEKAPACGMLVVAVRSKSAW